METTGRTLRSRLVSLLLALCIAAGFVPLIDYSAFAADNETTIGELELKVPRSGNGWSWNGDTLKLFGVELRSKDENTPKISYSGYTLKISISGYNRAVGDSLLAVSSDIVEISGNGILECDSAGALLDCNVAEINRVLLKAPDATLFKERDNGSQLDHNYEGYLEIGTLNPVNMSMGSGVIKCNELQFDGDQDTTFYQNGGVFYADKVTVGAGDKNHIVNCKDNSIFRTYATDAPTPSDLVIKQEDPSIVMVGGTNATVESDNPAYNAPAVNVYCSKISNSKAIDDTDATAGVYYTQNNVTINDNVTLNGAVYFEGYANGNSSNSMGITIADGATVAGAKWFNTNSAAKVGKKSTVFFDSADFSDSTIEGNIYSGAGEVSFTDSETVSD